MHATALVPVSPTPRAYRLAIYSDADGTGLTHSADLTARESEAPPAPGLARRLGVRDADADADADAGEGRVHSLRPAGINPREPWTGRRRRSGAGR